MILWCLSIVYLVITSVFECLSRLVFIAFSVHLVLEHRDQPTPEPPVTQNPLRMKVNSPRCVGELTSKVNSRSEIRTKILLVVQNNRRTQSFFPTGHCRVGEGMSCSPATCLNTNSGPQPVKDILEAIWGYPWGPQPVWIRGDVLQVRNLSRGCPSAPQPVEIRIVFI